MINLDLLPQASPSINPLIYLNQPYFTTSTTQITISLNTKMASTSPISESHFSKLIPLVTTAVQKYMSAFDSSHDFSHILRVLSNAHTILSLLPETQQASLSKDLITLCCLLHDVGDHKYLLPGESSATMISNLLLSLNASPEVAQRIQVICSAVSYSSETRNQESREEVLGLIVKYPELAVVQDADRLDSIGAVGIGRLFSYGAAKVQERGMEGSMLMMRGKCFELVEIMKTAPGKVLAEERTRRMREFDEWWREEAGAKERGLQLLAKGDDKKMDEKNV